MPEREYRVFVHQEDDSYWAEVEGLPGCIASGRDLDELREAIVEAITLYLAGDEVATTEQRAAGHGRVDEMRVLVSA